jgi:hypothetical protein
LGPVQVYVAPGKDEDVRFSVVPTHSGPLLLTVGVPGTGATTAVVLTGPSVPQPASETLTVYVPESAMAADVKLIDSCEDENPLGPVHAYVAPLILVAVMFNAWPAHTGPLLAAETDDTMATFVVATSEEQRPDTVRTEYNPARVRPALLMTGFCAVDVNPPGPVQ